MGVSVWARTGPPSNTSSTTTVSTTSPGAKQDTPDSATSAPPRPPAPPPENIQQNHCNSGSSQVSDRDAGVSILEPGLATQLPMETKQRADDQRRWYRQFARNMGGMLEDKPYKNLQW